MTVLAQPNGLHIVTLFTHYRGERVFVARAAFEVDPMEGHPGVMAALDLALAALSGTIK